MEGGFDSLYLSLSSCLCVISSRLNFSQQKLTMTNEYLFRRSKRLASVACLFVCLLVNVSGNRITKCRFSNVVVFLI